MKKLTVPMRMYFERMLCQLEENKLVEREFIQFYQDMADTGYAWENEELSLHCRMLMQKGIIQIPKNYNLVEVSLDELVKMRANRELSKRFVN